ncbi:MAG: hypothetical protein EXR71_00870 [Myxococcales bacterium]|nr:hypothetical protein [Myxococcales bacterium]
MPVYLSLPVACLPGTRVDNAEVAARVRARFVGSALEWKGLERGLRLVFQSCGTSVRHMETDEPMAPALHAARRLAEVLGENGRSAEDLDTVIYGSIARTVFEPAMACEVAGRVGANRALAYDIVAACAGPILAIEAVVGKAAIDRDWRLGAITSASLSEGHLSYDIGSLSALESLAAGLTIGNASTAMLLSREPFAHGGRLLATYSQGAARNYELCSVPTSGPFRSARATLMGLAAMVPDHVRRVTARAGVALDEIDLYVLHQPSDRVLRGVARALGVAAERIPQLHGLHANTEASAVPLALRTLYDQGRLRPGMKLLLGSAAAGFTLASAVVEWEG